MKTLIIKKPSDRRAAMALRRALLTARKGLTAKTNSSPNNQFNEFAQLLDEQSEALASSIARYDQLQDFPLPKTQPHLCVSESLSSLPRQLIEGRLRRRITLKALSARCGIAPPVLCQYERTLYQGVSLKRLIQIAKALESFD